ncbi:hypothetical protein MSP8887_01192 [Marinomonas spartinae]|uniref:DUF4870 family protein n=1 Tax=Marinomonas spartinae TaxID=1792290 RepID=UPI000808BC9E|nr:hypothetical protein [Marinomonas spartinae]SBS29930.1 hypothetical protein MSP8887_01192 [Marinomonas spartinae]
MTKFEPNFNVPRFPDDEESKKHATIAYIFMLLGLFTGVFWLVGAIWAMVKREDARDTLYEDHYQNIISTFWWGIVMTLLGVFLVFFFIGYLVLLFTWIWSIYRIIAGTARILSNQPYMR